MKSIIIRRGKFSGKTLAIFGGVHGDEEVGVKIIDELKNGLSLEEGTVYLVYANTEAIKKKKRFVERDLNRCFFSENKNSSLEDRRARKLIKIMDKCDAVLDLHSFSDQGSDAFAICEKNAFEIANKFKVAVVSDGWSEAEPNGTDGYMFDKGKIGICLECGPKNEINKSLKVARHAVEIFLDHFGCKKTKQKPSKKKKRYITAFRAVKKEGDNFRFSKKFRNFETLPDGIVFAYDGKKEYKADKGNCIILPTPCEVIGGEVFVLGKEKIN